MHVCVGGMLMPYGGQKSALWSLFSLLIVDPTQALRLCDKCSYTLATSLALSHVLLLLSVSASLLFPFIYCYSLMILPDWSEVCEALLASTSRVLGLQSMHSLP